MAVIKQFCRLKQKSAVHFSENPAAGPPIRTYLKIVGYCRRPQLCHIEGTPFYNFLPKFFNTADSLQPGLGI